ncbi:MAG: pyridoxamine 5'-phosphate oxidase family protein [Thermoproteota archaeon]|nr:pyridoxamine 5'-phosphate oxidase family protein [Thermoproteota archaeon]
MKILNTGPELGSPLSEQEIISFLSNSKLNLHLGTVNERNQPNIHPIWYYYDAASDRIYAETSRHSKKLDNIRKNKTVYFCVDEPNYPKGVKGKGIANVHEDVADNLKKGKKIWIKYLGSLEHPMALSFHSYMERGESVVLEIIPDYYFAWDLGKGQKE